MAWTNQNVILYHGTSLVRSVAIRSEGGFDLNKCRSDVDFGAGIYTTTNLMQAEKWAKVAALWTNSQSAVMSFSIDRSELALLETLFFLRKQPDFFDFVNHCRTCYPNSYGKVPHNYQVVAGLVVKWPVQQTHPNFDQISFHTPASCKFLYDAFIGEGK